MFFISGRVGHGACGGQASGEGAGYPREAGKVEEKILHDRGYGSVVLRRPDARLAVTIVADANGDVAHGYSLDLAAFWMFVSIVRRGTVIIRKPTAVGQTALAR